MKRALLLALVATALLAACNDVLGIRPPADQLLDAGAPRPGSTREAPIGAVPEEDAGHE